MSPGRTGARPDDAPRILPPEIGASFPGWSAQAAVLLVGAGLSGLVVHGFWLFVAVVLAVVATASPRTLVAWVLMVYLGVAALTLPHDGWTWRFALLLLGLPVLHVAAAFSLALPPGGRVATGVLVAPVRRLVLIQVPVQALAAVVLLTLAPGGGAPHLRPAAVVAGAALVVGVVLLVWRWRTPR
ncbi:hypothetical protein GCM10023221_29760 [Luteimicrobium xylanilyticum]|uniref:Uncharacterized protein n=1 Tax=Luteimicrobium xylanilyticum TaxID=1133546 RepID=A0A5P9QBE7_9MICO|nr:hypothetical protein [Luteimicrobium xylanilyticum]QFU98757.1 hypothetical protein KDY119_02276 [Luteimicrobium xylanilyticum]